MSLISKKYIFSKRSLLVVLISLAMGFISGKFLFHGSALNILPWGIIAILTAFIATNKREALTLGAIFGFVMSYSFLWFNNSNIKSLGQVLVLIVLIILPALFGLFCGLAMAWFGWIVRSKLRNQHA
jgi:hypothetical protein